jgi:hypothetical protein
MPGAARSVPDDIHGQGMDRVKTTGSMVEFDIGRVHAFRTCAGRYARKATGHKPVLNLACCVPQQRQLE